MLRILIADDHPIIRSGIKYLLKNHFYNEIQVHEADNGDQIITFCKQYEADMVLMDLNMPGTDPQRVVQTLLALQPALKVIIFTMNKEVIFGPMYLKIGAMAFVPKELGEQELLKAVKSVLAGNVYIRKEMQPFYQGQSSLQNPYELLTRKEIEVLRHFSQGSSAADIAQMMNIGVSTVSTHKANIFEKLKVSNLVELKLLTDLYPL